MWTLDELVDRVRQALADAYPGAPNGRVRDVPDRRAIRWYTTTGLVDRPLGTQGRVALYGPRHLLQLVALKRRQAAGRTLAEIQAELSGAPDDVLATVAQVAPALLVPGDGPQPDLTPRPRFWAAAATTGRAAALVVEEDLPAVGGVDLGGGAILVLPGLPTSGDRAAIAAAARPLMELLAERGLLKSEKGLS